MKPSTVPARIPIAHDDHHASRIGRLKDGRQFFVTTPFVPALGSEAGREFVAVYLFDAAGALLEARIDDLGVRSEVDEAAARALLEKRVAELGVLSYGDIEVEPIATEKATNSVHRGFRPERWERLKHYLLFFRDDTFECLAEGWTVEVVPGTFRQVVNLAVERMFATP